MAKAIETAWRGYRFRSRLEARWAVFFEAMGWQWEFEPEGFEAETGERYLPDFLVRLSPSSAVWLEVKPGDYVERVLSGAPDEVRDLRRMLATMPGVLILTGPPEWRGYLNAITLAERAGLCKPLGDHSEEMQVLGVKGRTWSELWATNGRMHNWEPMPEYIAAVHAARSARFEFGEQPI